MTVPLYTGTWPVEITLEEEAHSKLLHLPISAFFIPFLYSVIFIL